jgi:hypothetical protein
MIIAFTPSRPLDLIALNTSSALSMSPDYKNSMWVINTPIWQRSQCRRRRVAYERMCA